MTRLRCGLTMLLFTGFATAGNITISYTGTITSSGVPFISLGDHFSGSVTYSSPSSLVIDNSPTNRIYSMGQSGDGINLSVDGFLFTAGADPNMMLAVWPNYPGSGDDLLNMVSNSSSAGNFNTNYDPAYTFLTDLQPVLRRLRISSFPCSAVSFQLFRRDPRL